MLVKIPLETFNGECLKLIWFYWRIFFFEQNWGLWGTTTKLSQGLHLSYWVRCSPADQSVKEGPRVGTWPPLFKKEQGRQWWAEKGSELSRRWGWGNGHCLYSLVAAWKHFGFFTLNKKGGHLCLSSKAVTRHGAGRGVNIPGTPDPQKEIRGCWEEQRGADAEERANNVYCTLGFPTVNDRKKIKQSMLLKPGILTHV